MQMLSEGALSVSIHAPRAGSDAMLEELDAEGLLFQSTLPVRGATCVVLSLLYLS